MSGDWHPAAEMATLRQRAGLLADIRAFFAQREVLEVETPLVAAYGATDPNIDSFSTHYRSPGAAMGRDMHLQTSPEFAMKRLLAAGSGPIYQICKAFRNGETGRLHNPEFTMLEWYRPGFDYHRLMTEVDDLLQTVLQAPPALRVSYAEIIERYLRLDPHTASIEQLRACAAERDIVVSDALGDDRDAWLSLLWTHIIEPDLGGGRPVLVFDYPQSQAMLAQVRAVTPAVAERFELYVAGVELANGFQELQDAGEQRRRFEDNRRLRREAGMQDMLLDEKLLAALAGGLPMCSGVALGLDRLLMLKLGVKNIHEVLSFPFDRA